MPLVSDFIWLTPNSARNSNFKMSFWCLDFQIKLFHLSRLLFESTLNVVNLDYESLPRDIFTGFYKKQQFKNEMLCPQYLSATLNPLIRIPRDFEPLIVP